MTARDDSEALGTARGGLAATPEADAPAAAPPRARPRMRLGGFLGLVAAVFVAASAAVTLLPHDPYIRYQSFQGTIFDRLGWVYDRLVHDPTPIDVLVVGSSRSARGANAALLEEALAELGRDGLHVANISEPAAGMDIRLTKIRLALEHHPEIRLIVLGVVEALPRDGHQAFGDLASPGEVLTAPWIVNRTLPGDLARLPYRQIELALATALPDAFGYHAAFDPGAYRGPTPDHRLFDRPDWTAEAEARTLDTAEHAAALEAESRLRHRQITPPILPESIAWIEFGVSRHYVAEIAKLAEAHGVKLAFLFLPFYQGYDDPIEAAWLERFGPLWQADFLRETPANYADAAHASQRGVALIAPWLAARIDETLEPAP